MILIVEDNLDLVRYMIGSFNGVYELEIAYDGQEGIDRALDLLPDIILTDVMMPEKDGFELCDELKSHEFTSHIPIIMLTAKADVESRIIGLEKGADAYMDKPFLEEELHVRIQALLNQRKKLQKYYLSKAGLSNPEINAPSKYAEFITTENQFLQRVNHQIEVNLDNHEFGVEKLSDTLAVSPSKLFRKIKALTGLNTNQYLRAYRLARAKELLQDPELTISEIAYQVGFSDPRYFSKAFKKHTGMTPSFFKAKRK